MGAGPVVGVHRVLVGGRGADRRVGVGGGGRGPDLGPVAVDRVASRSPGEAVQLSPTELAVSVGALNPVGTLGGAVAGVVTDSAGEDWAEWVPAPL